MNRPIDERAEALFLAAQALPAAEREVFLRRECGDDAALCAAVEGLLAAAVGSEAYFDSLAARLGAGAWLQAGVPSAAAARSDGGNAPSESVGPYTLIEQIGHGGMGSVWLAERSDGRFEGRVAIKLLNLDRGVAAARRFELEGSYLARLTHPNIARLLDAGLTTSGQPFLVIELVDGVQIDHYADERELSVPARIELYLNVLDAVAHAHASLIVHRDLKPSNVLVTRNGVVKLLDFGVAKLLHADEDAPANVTREVGPALTPEYAAPEQLLGQPVTTATDVYALGLVLCVLLAGRHARADAARGVADALQLIAAGELPTLSELVARERETQPALAAANARRRQATPESLRRVFRGDLDTIVRKALATDPAERYATVTELAEDLRRYLRHEPVRAQPTTVRYRLNKFVRRNRGSVAAALLIAFALVASTAITGWQMVEARRQRDVALYQQQRVQATSEFLSLLLEDVGSGDEPLTAVQLLDHGAAMLEQQYGTEQRFLAPVLLEVSRRIGALGERAVELRLLQQAEAIARANGDDDALAMALCSTTRNHLIRDPPAAEAKLAEARLALGRLRRPSVDTQVGCARAEAAVLEMHGDGAAAVATLQAARAAVAADPAASMTSRGVLANDLAVAYARGGRTADALVLLDEVLELMRHSGRGSTMSYLSVLANRGVLLAMGGQYADQEQVWQEILHRADQAQLTQRLPPAFAGRHAQTLMGLARYDEALSLMLASRAQAVERDELVDIAHIDLHLAELYVRMQRADEAREHLTAAEELLSRNAGNYANELSIAALLRSDLARLDGDDATAGTILQQVLDSFGYPAAKGHPMLPAGLRRATLLALARGDAQAAEGYAEDQYLAAAAKALDPHASGEVGQSLHLRAQAREALGNTAGAIADLRLAVEALTRGLGADHPETREAQTRLARLTT